jgi:hypothetical protein
MSHFVFGQKMKRLQNAFANKSRIMANESTNPADDADSPLATTQNSPLIRDDFTLSATAISELLYMIEEEKLAGDIYEALYEQTGVKAFDRIAASEDSHVDALVRQAEADGVDLSDILLMPEGTYQDDTLQALYDDLLAQGSQSATAALEVGVAIETKDIVDLEVASESVEGTKLAEVYDALLAGSESHLEAFQSLLG